MNLKTESETNWKFIFIWLPLSPFLLFFIIKMVIISTSCFNFEEFLYSSKNLILSSVDFTTLSFVILIMPFLVKNNLIEHKIQLPNKDKENESESSILNLILLSASNLILFVLYLTFDTIYKDCKIGNFAIIYDILSFSILIMTYITIKKMFRIRKMYKLKSKILL